MLSPSNSPRNAFEPFFGPSVTVSQYIIFSRRHPLDQPLCGLGEPVGVILDAKVGGARMSDVKFLATLTVRGECRPCCRIQSGHETLGEPGY
jgi:hypothetical protein